MSPRIRAASLLASAVAVLLSSPVHSAPARVAVAPVAPVSDADKAIIAAIPGLRSALDRTLLDYPRARFMEVRTWTSPSGTVSFCGMVNSPNKMGAMTGWTPFVSISDGSLFFGGSNLFYKSVCLGDDLAPHDWSAEVSPRP